MTVKYNQWQQTYCLAETVSALSGYKTPSKTTKAGQSPELSELLASCVDNTLQNPANIGLIGSWERVWGPVVWQAADSDAADNAMMVVANPAESQFVVAIAGTGQYSTYDQKVEDADLKHLSWPDFGPNPGKGDPIVTQGTADGLQVLMGMTSGWVPVKVPVNLWGYLPTVTGTDITLTFTGHSLGGALVMPLALYLFSVGESPLKKSYWGDVYVYPTAAPTPGNAVFNGLFSNMFAPNPLVGSGYEVWNEIVWNEIDVVPHAWTLEKDSNGGALPYLQEIRTIYDNPPIKGVDVLVSDAVARAELAGGGLVFNANNASLPGKPTLVPTTLEEFLEQALYQHLTAYQTLLGVGDFQVAAPPGGGATDLPLTRSRLPVIGAQLPREASPRTPAE